MTFANKFAGKCNICGTDVSANAGEYDWKLVWCRDCADHIAKSDRMRLLEAISASLHMGDDDDYDHEDSYVMEQYFGHDGEDGSLPLVPIWKQTDEMKARIAAAQV